jgi:octaprenyl-diphosphate synthase
VDRSELRRDKPAAWLKYTPEYAVLAGDYLLARVMVNLSRYGNLKLIQLTAEIISDLLEGEWIQDSLIEDWDVSLTQLDRVHNLKTASLFKWCMRAPFIALGDDRPELHKLLIEMGSLLGILFQRSDDLLDFDIRNYEGKAILSDLKSGYMNSYAAFLTNGLDERKRLRFKECKSLEDIYKVLGEDYFFNKLKEFDTHNEKVMRLYSHYADEVENLLGPEKAKLVDEFRLLPAILYWRKA